jgi:hypothetical protein
MNVIQQEALAKTFGLQRDELADILVQQENLNKTRGAYVSLGEKTIEQLKASGNIEKGVFNRIENNTATAQDYFRVLKDNQSILEAQGQSLIQILGDESLASLQAQDAQSKFNDALEKAKEIFSTLVGSGILDKLSNSITDFVIALSQGKGIIRQAFFGSNINESDRINYEKSQLEEKYSSTTDVNEQKQIKEQIKSLEKQAEMQPQIEVLKYSQDLSKQHIQDLDNIRPYIPESAYKFLKELSMDSIKEKDKQIMLLEKLVSAVEKGGNVYIDGTSVGRATVMANSKMG